MNNEQHYNKVCSYYTKHAERIDKKYNQSTFEEIHNNWFSKLDLKPGKALDVGAGIGRDPLGLLNHNWDVFAVEPSKGLYNIGKEKTKNIKWFNDSLPNLESIPNHNFDLILVSGVWMHIHPNDREQSFKVLKNLLNKNGIIVFKIRYGPSTNDELFFDINNKDIFNMATKYNLKTVLHDENERDTRKRSHVSWETIVLRN